MNKQQVTCKDLIEILSLQDPDTVVALSSDSEGNFFAIMHKYGCFMADVYLDDEFGGQMEYVGKDEYLQAKDKYIKVKYGETHEKDKLVKCVILFSTN